jgi:protein-S-isoprenylcysteine O-methyltransferase Ste14
MLQFASYPSPLYAIVFTASFWGWCLFEIWVFSRDLGKKMRDSRGGGGWIIITLAIAITLGLNMPNIAPMFNIRSYFAVYFVLGIVLIWGGILFRFWSIQTLGNFFSTKLVIQERHELITTGPYRYIRNPSYTGALITFIGFGLGTGNWLSPAVFLCAGLLAYARRIRIEESMLLAQFGGKFEEYKKRTRALIPFVW